MDAVLARDTSHILRVALIFAVADQACQVERCHLEAALAIIDYSRDSARWIFGQATGNKLANLILWELCRNPGGLTRDTILHEVCSGNTTKTQLNRALSELAKNKLARMVLEKAEKGRPTERWSAGT